MLYHIVFLSCRSARSWRHVRFGRGQRLVPLVTKRFKLINKKTGKKRVILWGNAFAGRPPPKVRWCTSSCVHILTFHLSIQWHVNTHDLVRVPTHCAQGCRLGRPPVKAILKGLLRQGFTIISIDEFRTSKMCCGCGEELVIDKDIPEDEVHTISLRFSLSHGQALWVECFSRIDRLPHGLLCTSGQASGDMRASRWCMNKACKTWGKTGGKVDRDANACANFIKIAQAEKRGQERPECLQRPKKTET